MLLVGLSIFFSLLLCSPHIPGYMCTPSTHFFLLLRSCCLPALFVSSKTRARLLYCDKGPINYCNSPHKKIVCMLSLSTFWFSQRQQWQTLGSRRPEKTGSATEWANKIWPKWQRKKTNHPFSSASGTHIRTCGEEKAATMRSNGDGDRTGTKHQAVMVVILVLAAAVMARPEMWSATYVRSKDTQWHWTTCRTCNITRQNDTISLMCTNSD